jgi:hypothetical protein
MIPVVISEQDKWLPLVPMQVGKGTELGL